MNAAAIIMITAAVIAGAVITRRILAPETAGPHRGRCGCTGCGKFCDAPGPAPCPIPWDVRQLTRAEEDIILSGIEAATRDAGEEAGL